MIFQIHNPTVGDYEYYDTYDEAMAKLVGYQADLLIQESARFTVAKEIVNGNDTTWMNADLENDPEDFVYQVFNHLTGQHEKVESLTQAKNRNAEIKQAFLISSSMIEPVSIDQRPAPRVQPISQGAQTL